MHGALTMALIVAAASLLCGLTIYPFIVHLSADNARKTDALLESHLSMMDVITSYSIHYTKLYEQPLAADGTAII